MITNTRLAVITGANGGLGRVAAKRLADAGYSLALFTNDEAALKQLVDELALPTTRYLTSVMDFRDPRSGQNCLEMTLEKFNRADILLHFVGGWTGGKTIPEAEVAQFDEMLQQHFWTTLHLIQAFSLHFVANGWGRIVIVSSPTATAPPAKGAPYSVGKAAQETLLLTLAQETKHTGVTTNIIRVNAIDARHERDLAPTPGNKSWSTPEEISEAILFLCSDQASTINGARIPLYGSP